ncbi:MAG: potassium channel protein [Nitrospirae bacterium]|nr:potassium channel protein [Nitrospirota bacterium]
MKDELTEQILKRFTWAGIALFLVIILGTLGYRVIGGDKYSLVDCLYMTVITISTIGYGEIVDLANNPIGRVFTMVIALCGIGSLTYILSNVTAFIVEGELNEAFRRRKMEKLIEKFKDHHIVCGIEGVGFHIVNELYETKRPYVIVDIDRKKIEKILPTFHTNVYIEGDATDNDTLLKAGINRATGLFAVSGDDNLNMVISLTAKQLNPSIRVVARSHDLKNIEKMKMAGADAVVSPTFIGGLRMASEMVRPAVVSFLDIMLRDKERGLRIEEVEIPASYVGKPLSALSLKRYKHTLLLAIRTLEDWVFNPQEDYLVQPSSTLVLMSNPEERELVLKGLTEQK